MCRVRFGDGGFRKVMEVEKFKFNTYCGRREVGRYSLDGI